MTASSVPLCYSGRPADQRAWACHDGTAALGLCKQKHRARTHSPGLAVEKGRVVALEGAPQQRRCALWTEPVSTG